MKKSSKCDSLIVFGHNPRHTPLTERDVALARVVASRLSTIDGKGIVIPTPPSIPTPVGLRSPVLRGEINDDGSGAGVTGVGFSATNPGVAGDGGRIGVVGFSNLGVGVLGYAPRAQQFNTTQDFEGISGMGIQILQSPFGFLGGRDPVFGQLAGVYGQSDQQGVMGLSNSASGTGVYGGSTSSGGGSGIGVRGETSGGVGVQGQSFGAGLAGKFLGDVEVTGNLNMSSPTSDIVLGDVAEGFGTREGEIIEPGTVVVLDEHGLVRPGDAAYDKKVAGVVSGAGNYRPAIILDKSLSQLSRLPVALIGKVYCKVDAQYSSIEVGDLLTTSPTPGHAMKAADPLKAFGSVIGKALCPLNAGQGMIPILIALQ